MGHRKVIENYYIDVNNITDLLTKLISNYRALIGGAIEINGITLAHKSDVKDALKRVDKIGKIIDNILAVLEQSSNGYLDYCKLKAEVMEYHLEAQYIQTEIETELKSRE